MKHQRVVLTVKPHHVVARFVHPVTEVQDARPHGALQLRREQAGALCAPGPQDMRKINEVKITAVAPAVYKAHLRGNEALRLVRASARCQQRHGPVGVLLAEVRQEFQRLPLAPGHGVRRMGQQSRGVRFHGDGAGDGYSLHHSGGLQQKKSEGELGAVPQGRPCLPGGKIRCAREQHARLLVFLRSALQRYMQRLLGERIFTPQTDGARRIMVAAEAKAAHGLLALLQQRGVRRAHRHALLRRRIRSLPAQTQQERRVPLGQVIKKHQHAVSALAQRQLQRRIRGDVAGEGRKFQHLLAVQPHGCSAAGRKEERRGAVLVRPKLGIRPGADMRGRVPSAGDVKADVVEGPVHGKRLGRRAVSNAAAGHRLAYRGQRGGACPARAYEFRLAGIFMNGKSLFQPQVDIPVQRHRCEMHGRLGNAADEPAVDVSPQKQRKL